MNFLKRFFDYLKMLLKKQEKIEEKIEASEESNGEDLSLEQEEIQTEDLYSQIEIGDIIRAKRYKNETQKESIPEGHREGPYIVLNKENGNLICTQGTSVVPYKEDDDVYFYLNVEGYNLVKSTFFKLFRIDEVNNNQIIKVIDKLKEEDKQRLFRKIKLAHKTYYTSEGSLIRLNLPIQIGDIINYNVQNLLVLDINKNNLICLLLKETIDYKDNKLLEYINFKNLDYSKTTCLEINSKLKYINAINNKCLKK